MRTILIILSIAVLSSCSIEQRIENREQRALKKIKKLALKYPGIIHKDTIRDTFVVQIPTVRVDTAVRLVDGETTTIYKDRLKIQYRYENDTLYLSGECKGDTIYHYINVPCDNIVVTKESWLTATYRKGKSLLWVIVLIFCLYFALRFLKKISIPF